MTAARAQVSGLHTEVETLERRLAIAERMAAEAPELQAALDAERAAKEAAEREAACAQRQVAMLTQAAGGDESFEAALAAELGSMREAYEARLARAGEKEREMEREHRHQMKALQESADRERRAAEARGRVIGAHPTTSGALTAR